MKFAPCIVTVNHHSRWTVSVMWRISERSRTLWSKACFAVPSVHVPIFGGISQRSEVNELSKTRFVLLSLQSLFQYMRDSIKGHGSEVNELSKKACFAVPSGYVPIFGGISQRSEVNELSKTRFILLSLQSLFQYLGDSFKDQGSEVNELLFCCPYRILPLHDSAQILAVRIAAWQKEITAVREWYKEQHRNWVSVNGERSKWWVWNEASQHAQCSVRRIQDYLQRISEGRQDQW